MELHDCMHVPYRDSCKLCNMGRGRGMPHTHSQGSPVPTVGVDYFLITSEGIKKRKELSFETPPQGEKQLLDARGKGGVSKCLPARCFNSMNPFSREVPVKGAGEEDYVANLVMTTVLWLGQLGVILRGDNGPALQALIGRALHIIRVKVLYGDIETTLKRLAKE